MVEYLQGYFFTACPSAEQLQIHPPPLELVELPNCLVIPPSSKLYLLEDILPLPVLECSGLTPLAIAIYSYLHSSKA